jgi:Clp amino terminal domain, pathogenicity island component
MFERFTQPSRRVVVLAQEEARLLDHNYIGTEHILLGLIHEGEGVAARAIASLGLTLQMARDQVTDMIGRGQQTPTGHIPFTPRAKKVLELSLREALALKDDYIGTEHILLGLIREADGVGAQILDRIAPLLVVREAVLELALAEAAESAEADQPLAVEWPALGSSGGGFRRTALGVVNVRAQVVTEFRETLATISETLAALGHRLDGIERQLGIRTGAPAEAASEPQEPGPGRAPEDTVHAPQDAAQASGDIAQAPGEAGPAPEENTVAADETAQASEETAPEESPE